MPMTWGMGTTALPRERHAFSTKRFSLLRLPERHLKAFVTRESAGETEATSIGRFLSEY